MSNEIFFTNCNLCSIIIFALIVRWSVSLHPYSGNNSPPMFGDYEAQRHWMEITVSVPMEEWYFNTSSNDLLYWGLDYPPLTAYHSYVNGKIANFINPDFVKLHTSRGYESYNHKLFMRTTVVLSDVLTFFTSVVLYCNIIYKANKRSICSKSGEVPDDKIEKRTKWTSIDLHTTYLTQVAVALLYPGLILIDHGHFQYNSISLGATVAAIAVLFKDQFISSAVLFCVAINYKQMSLYHSLPFFVYMLSHCLPSKTQSFFMACRRLLSISMTVVITFIIIWLPFLRNYQLSAQVIHRLFPLARGIFEDKVSNIWCVLNIFYKLNSRFTQSEMAKICITLVLSSSLPSLINLFKHATMNKLILSLINVSLSFFLFSYQVHEKSILLVALPVLLYFPFDPFPCFWFLLVSNFSMLPLLLKDDLGIPFVSLSVLFSLFVLANINFLSTHQKSLTKRFANKMTEKTIVLFVSTAFKLSLFGCVILFVCSLNVQPPVQYPDLWPLLISVYSCMHFCAFLCYFNYTQMVDS